MSNPIKVVVATILFLNIMLTRSEWIFQRCDYQIATNAIAPVIWYEQTTDGVNQPHFITRFLHNKPGVYMSQFSKCYFQAMDPYLLYKTIGIGGFMSVLYLIYCFIDRRKYIQLAIIFLLPIFPFIKISLILQILIYKVLALVGLYYFLKNENGKK